MYHSASSGSNNVTKLPCLVRVREPRVEWRGFDVSGRFDHLWHFDCNETQLVFRFFIRKSVSHKGKLNTMECGLITITKVYNL